MFLRSALGQFYRETERDQPGLTLTIPGEPDRRGGVPGGRAEHRALDLPGRTGRSTPVPDASFDTGLDVFGLHRLRTLSTAAARPPAPPSRAVPKGRDVVLRHDLAELTVRAGRPTALQLDGEPIGDRGERALRVPPRGALAWSSDEPVEPASLERHGVTEPTARR